MSETIIADDGYGKKYEVPEEQVDFKKQIEDAIWEGLLETDDDEVRWYNGRSYYNGYGVTVDGQRGLVAAIRATTMPIQWDTMGYDGYIVYPRRGCVEVK